MKKIESAEPLKNQIEKDFKCYIKWMFGYGSNSHIVVCKENQMYGFQRCLVFMGVITEKQCARINKEMYKIRNKYLEKYLDNTLNEQRDIKTIDKLLEQFQKNIEIILSESKEESK